MSEHRSILEKLTRLRDQLPTTQLVMERAQELFDALNEYWVARYLDEQQDLLQLITNHANGRQLDETLLYEATKPLAVEEQRLGTGHFWAEAGEWQSAAKALNCTEAGAKELLPDLARAYRDLELQIELLDAKAMDLCQPKLKPVREELPPEAQKLPRKYQKDKRRYKTGWGV